METPAFETSAAYSAEQPFAKEQAGVLTPEKEAELSARDKELEALYWKLDYLKRNGQEEQLRAVQAAQRHITATRELLAERGPGSISQDIVSKDFLLWVDCSPTDFGYFTVKLMSGDAARTPQEFTVFEDAFGIFTSDPCPTKESIKNAFFAARDRFAAAQHRNRTKTLTNMETSESIH